MTKVELLIEALARAATAQPVGRDQVILTAEQARLLAKGYQDLCWQAATTLRQICQ